ncbi:tRNA-dihydrouridine synthase [uncultured Clostridium sp.]|uniref:tRNA dihydrouridine synthase n=1 Tax=uncultured Clostridium sp. TaxID=59620 RepID=UPI002631ECBE|nr:tRNA-dihydrouridine synthase [uncultured Clostridium sp.]
MKYYLAPMEGLTGFIYRNAHNKYFGNIDKYFTPFIVPTSSKKLKTKELRDVLPENNKDVKVIPQILTNDAEGFINTAYKLKEMGYDEINLNLGCPSGTVVAKGRGSGFLAFREELDLFLEKVFTEVKDMKISIKTRIGKEDGNEFYELIEIFNKYKLEELIIHPRTQKDFYGNTPNLEIFEDGIKLSTNPICYNGDIFTVDDYKEFTKRFKNIDRIMLGRGILANPGLINEIEKEEYMNKETLKKFHDEILNTYLDVLKDERNTLFRMKELWGYLNFSFEEDKKYLKAIKKSQKVRDYNEAVKAIFREKEILKGSGFNR